MFLTTTAALKKKKCHHKNSWAGNGNYSTCHLIARLKNSIFVIAVIMQTNSQFWKYVPLAMFFKDSHVAQGTWCVGSIWIILKIQLLLVKMYNADLTYRICWLNNTMKIISSIKIWCVCVCVYIYTHTHTLLKKSFWHAAQHVGS